MSDTVAGLITRAGVGLEDELRQAVVVGTAGAALRTALREGNGAFLRHMAERFFARQGMGEFGLAMLHPALVLVAERDSAGSSPAQTFGVGLVGVGEGSGAGRGGDVLT
jgi:hypothetical protein